MSEDITTRRTRVRPATPADRDLWVRLHTDPEQYPFAPWWVSTEAQAEEFLERVLAHHEEHGFGYGVVESREDGRALGVAGVVLGAERTNLNLYYRLDLEAHGEGLGREVARAVVADAVEHGPDLPLTATARPDHRASIRTAESAGLALVGAVDGADLAGVPADVVARARANDPAEVPAAVVLLAPRPDVRREPFDADTRAAVLDLWCAVTEAGGAVGFTPGAPRADVAAALARHEEGMAAGLQVAVLLRDPWGGVVAAGWWAATGSPLLAHRRTAYRVMTDPARRGRNLGRLLMAAMHRTARADGVEIADLGVRGGTGTEGFYAALGYTEAGRVRGGIRVAPGDDRDDITMIRHL
ncbi:GNAT family N-acetyltransferase [Phycicoccus sp. BSK3Z-2]|uniref:GNAT family N-acetyltransferase n=1 Tax=Phycicoccus avicenniae TaxID=2828860 RepID=A0A941D9U5_9MICO|nr:GNAT family N-acetyltransferase [Phycicoccus avicenniae]MBR7744146.1 GNAT family N-acetyltransferase [Phycicoccus avicenniae]